MPSRNARARQVYARGRRAEHQESGSCVNVCGGCFFFMGLLSLILACVYVVGPGVRGVSYEEGECRVKAIELGYEDMRQCDCGSYCKSQAPCVKITVDVDGMATQSILHPTLSALEHYTGCSFDNRDCAMYEVQNQIAARDWVAESYEVNATYACFYDSDDLADVVQDNEFNEKDVINALTWPMLFIALGCCLMCNANPDCREFGYTCCMCMCLPFIACGKGYQMARAKCQGRPRPRDRVAPQGCLRRRGGTNRRGPSRDEPDDGDDEYDAYDRRARGHRTAETPLPMYDPATRPDVEYDIDGNPAIRVAEAPPAYDEAPPPDEDTSDSARQRTSSDGALDDDDYVDVEGVAPGEQPPPYVPSAPSSPTTPSPVGGLGD